MMLLLRNEILDGLQKVAKGCKRGHTKTSNQEVKLWQLH